MLAEKKEAIPVTLNKPEKPKFDPRIEYYSPFTVPFSDFEHKIVLKRDDQKSYLYCAPCTACSACVACNACVACR